MPNTQTSVPAFTSGQVLTAQQMMDVNTGIPVFATTTTRDAAFGGTGEKVLAEGQMAYIEASNLTQYYDGAAWQTLNGGLVFIKSVTVGSGVTSAAVTGVFSSTFDNYRIVIANVDTSTLTNIRLQLGATTTGYYASQYYDNATGTPAPGTDRINNSSSSLIGVTSQDDDTNSSFDIYGPNLAKRTQWSGTYASGGYSGWFGGLLANTTQYTDFTLGVGAGTMTGGTIRVYGYQNS
jgi:hypothetical protein